MTRSFQSISSTSVPLIDTLSPGTKTYRVAVFNPLSVIAGPRSYFYTLVLRGQDAQFLENYKEVAEYLSAFGLHIKSKDEAEALANAWVALGNFKKSAKSSCEYPPEGRRKVVTKADWVETAESCGPDWLVGRVAMTDAEIQAHQHFTLLVTENGKISVEDSKFLCGGGYI